MPADFDRCSDSGGRIRTIKPNGKDDPTYVPVCFDRKSGKSHAGHPRKVHRYGEKK